MSDSDDGVVVKLFQCDPCSRMFESLKETWMHQLQEYVEAVITNEVEKMIAGGKGVQPPSDRILRCQYCARIFLGLEAFLRHKITTHVELVLEARLKRHEVQPIGFESTTAQWGVVVQEEEAQPSVVDPSDEPLASYDSSASDSD